MKSNRSIKKIRGIFSNLLKIQENKKQLWEESMCAEFGISCWSRQVLFKR
jgi:hypothetical protein